MKVNSKITIGNTTQYYLKNTMLQVTRKGNEETRTIVDLRNNKVIKQFTKYICELCKDFDCKWCRNEVNK